MSEELDSGLFNIALSDSESDSSQKAAAPRDRTGQTEDAFQAVRAAYRPKVENGEVSLQPPPPTHPIADVSGTEKSLH